ncbi:MAG: aminoglycoside 6-adenylyltransferase, partial [Erysipelothrix sp.]|nr:aminoglycoside 6-adenylyltransferase [Erysipelothrix sp.]
SQIAKKVGNGLGYDYELNDELNMMGYLRQLKTESIDERRRNTVG